MEKQIKWFSQNHVAANFLMLIILVLGFTTWFKVKKEVFPDLALDAVVVSVAYPNASPDEVESGIINPIEDAIRNITGIERTTSSSAESNGAVTIEVRNGYDVREVLDDVKSKVDAIQIFPEGAERPIFEKLVIKNQVLSIAVTADADEYTLRKLAQLVRDGLQVHKMQSDGLWNKLLTKLRGEAGVSEANLAAVKDLELTIEISEQRLKQYNLTISQVAEKLRQASIDLPVGTIKSDSGDVLVRVKGKLYTVEEFNNVEVVNNPDGSSVKLSDIASVTDGFEDVDLISSFNGKPAALVNVYRTGNEDSVMISKFVKDYINHAAPLQLPEGVKLEIWQDQSKILQGRIDLLVRSISTGLVFVFLVLALFLRPSLAALVAVGIPVSFAGGIIMMPYLDVSINMITLFAFILVLGIVVDDAIVVGENVYGKIKEGMNPKKAAWFGTHEVGVVVIFGILTTMTAFTPMIGLDGVSGKIWPNIPYVVIPVLFFSLLQSKFVLPAHLAFLKNRIDGDKVGLITWVQHRVADSLEWFIEHIYRPVLRVCMSYKYVVFVGFIASFMLAIFLAKYRMRFDFLPGVEGDIISAKLEMPFGVQFEKTHEAIGQLEKAAQRVGEKFQKENGKPVTVHILASSGTQPFQFGFGGGFTPDGSHLGEVTMELVSAVDRPGITANKIINAWREEIKNIPGAVSLTFAQETAAAGNALDLDITGPKIERVKEAANYLSVEFSKLQGAKDVFTDNRLGKQEFVFSPEDITREGKNLGFTHMEVGRQVRAALFGEEVQRNQRGQDEVKVMVRFPKEERKSMDTIDKLKLKSPLTGEEVAMSQVVRGEPQRGQATIKHVDGNRAVRLSADVDLELVKGKDVLINEFEENTLSKLAQKFPGVSWSYQGEQRDQAQSVNQMSIKAIFALMVMYILIAIPLKSYLQPFIIMSVIPFGIVGAIVGHYILGYELSIMSMCGVIALAGVVVNDSLVMVEYVNRFRMQGGSVLEAVKTAGAKRFRPILLTSLTTFVGVMPMLWETDMQAKFLIPMAISLGFGILFATFITLILVPVVYLMLEDLKSLINYLWRRLTGSNTRNSAE